MEMYSETLVRSGFKVIHFPNYQELYKHLDGEGFTAILIAGQTTSDNLEFISKVRKGARVQIPFLVVLNDNMDEGRYVSFGNVTCFSQFPDSGKLVGELTRKLSHHSQFKGLLHDS